VKSAKSIFNLDESFSEYKNNQNNFQYLSENPISTSENGENDDPFETEFLNSLLENEENILEENEEELTVQNGNEEENIQFTPRKRKPQRHLKKVDQILENVNTFQYSNAKKNTLKLRNTKTENIEVQNVNEQERIQFTPRKRKPQRTLEKVDQILENVNTFQYSNAKKNTLKFRTRKE
jgi:hypothetical protein